MVRGTTAVLCTTLSVVRAAAAATAVRADDAPPPPVWPGRFHAMMSQVRNGDYGVVDLWYDYAAGRNLNIIQTQSGEEDGPLFDNERANGTTYYYHPAKAKSKYCNVIDFGVGIIRPDWLEGATYLGEEECGIYQCHKWEQGEIPEAHARFLGLRTLDEVAPSSKAAVADLAQENSRNIPGQMQSFLSAAAEGAGVVGQGVSREEGGVSLRGGDAESGGSKGGEGDRFITYWSEKGTDRPVKWLFFNDALFQVIRFDEGATMPDHAFKIPDYCFEEDQHD